jgi:hypothetical protein
MNEKNKKSRSVGRKNKVLLEGRREKDRLSAEGSGPEGWKRNEVLAY